MRTSFIPCKATCPLHVLGELVRTQPGCQPFVHITPSDARRMLRVMLGLVGVVDCARYRTQDLRRGHAKDLQLSGQHVVSAVFALASLARC